jgi:hypothetical protein
MFSVLLALLMSGLSAQDASPQMSPRSLKASGSHLLQVSPFRADGVIQCDEDSATYYHLFTGSYSRTVILRFSVSGDESKLYKLPSELADTTSFIDFSVSPDGSVSALVGDHEFHPIVFGFNSDGNVSSQAKLEVPEHVVGEHFAVFPNGTMLFYGYYGRQADKDVIGKRYAGLFKPSGQLLKKLDKVDLGDMKIDQLGTRLPDGGATVGKDGNVYVLATDKVVVVSPSGQIQRKIPFTKPDPGFSASNVQYSEGLLAISFAKPENMNFVFRYLVVNASDGEPLGLYEPTKETGDNNVCFSRHDGFLFLTVKNDRINFITAPLR